MADSTFWRRDLSWYKVHRYVCLEGACTGAWTTEPRKARWLLRALHFEALVQETELWDSTWAGCLLVWATRPSVEGWREEIWIWMFSEITPPLPSCSPISPPLLYPYPSSSRCHSCSLGWLSSSVLLLSGTPTCPGRHIGSKLSLQWCSLTLEWSDDLFKVGTSVFMGFGCWSELNRVSTMKWPISL